jgi:hypothetical protein
VERREAYVRGYIEGYYGGYLNGCQEGTKHSEPVATSVDNLPVNKCLDQKRNFSKGTDLSKEITAFYKRYTQNRNLLAMEILEEIGKGRSIEEIHDHPPFPTVEASKAPATK